MLERYVILPSKNAPLGEASAEYETLDEARSEAKPGDAIVAVQYELSDIELIEVVS